MTKFIPVAFAIVAFGSSLTSAFANGRTAADDNFTGQQASFTQSAPVASAGAASFVAADKAATDVVNKADRQY